MYLYGVMGVLGRGHSRLLLCGNGSHKRRVVAAGDCVFLEIRETRYFMM